MFHKNIPSMLSQVTKLLSDKGVNIENMQSKSRKDVAYTVLDCAGQVGQDALESLVDSEGIIRIRVNFRLTAAGVPGAWVFKDL